MNFKRRKYSFPPPSPPYNVGPLFQLPIENNKHPNFEWRGQGRGADSFALRSRPIYVQCLNNFVADCGQGKKRIHQPNSKFHQPQAIRYDFLCTQSGRYIYIRLSWQIAFLFVLSVESILRLILFPFSNTFWLELEKLAWPFTVVNAGMMQLRWPLDIHWYVGFDKDMKEISLSVL